MNANLNKLIDHVRSASSLDFNMQPGMRFSAHLRKELINTYSLHWRDAEQIASGLKMQFPNDATDDQAKELAEAYAVVVYNLMNAFEANGFIDPIRATINQMNKVELTCP